MNKKWWLVVPALVALATLLAISLLLSPTPGVTYANYSRIETGMTREQVEALLGKPNFKEMDTIGWFVSGVKVGPERPNDGDMMVGTWPLFWRSSEGDRIEVYLDKAGHVEAVGWNGDGDERTAFQKLRDRLPWIGQGPPPPMKVK